MLPAYRSGDRVVVNRLAYVLRDPRVGSAVVLRDPDVPSRYLLKRIEATTGDTSGGLRYEVLGDNRAESRDSRAFGAVTRGAIVGKVWFKY
jgi:hypothetical protein